MVGKNGEVKEREPLTEDERMARAERVGNNLVRMQEWGEKKAARDREFFDGLEKRGLVRGSADWLLEIAYWEIETCRRSRERRGWVKLVGESMALWKQRIQHERMLSPGEIEEKWQMHLERYEKVAGKKMSEKMKGRVKVLDVEAAVMKRG